MPAGAKDQSITLGVDVDGSGVDAHLHVVVDEPVEALDPPPGGELLAATRVDAAVGVLPARFQRWAVTDEEPAENISGGDAGGGRAVEFPRAADPETRAEAVVDRLGDIYWQTAYGGQDAFECLVRTILSQNTSDVASQPAHDALMDRYGPGGPAAAPDGDLAAALADAEQSTLAETIRSAGLYNQKSRRILDLAELVCAEYGGEEGFDAFVSDADPEEVRSTLLEFTGVGPKTADCVLLFAGGREGVFPVDTHVHRIARRLGVAPADADHETVREFLERAVPGEKCGFGHTAMIQFGREYCSARKPACLDDPEACPMADLCDQVGVYPATGEVVDPADAGGG